MHPGQHLGPAVSPDSAAWTEAAVAQGNTLSHVMCTMIQWLVTGLAGKEAARWTAWQRPSL